VETELDPANSLNYTKDQFDVWPATWGLSLTYAIGRKAQTDSKAIDLSN